MICRSRPTSTSCSRLASRRSVLERWRSHASSQRSRTRLPPSSAWLSGLTSTPRSTRRCARGFSSSTESVCASPIRCSASQSLRGRRRRVDGRSTHSSRLWSSVSSEPVTSLLQRPNRTTRWRRRSRTRPEPRPHAGHSPRPPTSRSRRYA